MVRRRTRRYSAPGLEEALREGDRRKDDFLATLAHELRNPLAPLRSGLQMARLHSKLDLPLQRTIEIMDRQLNQLVHLVDDLLDVGRISTGKIDLRRARVSVREVLETSAEASRTAIDEHGHTLIVEPAPEGLYVEGDFDRLTQVFSNLLSNAAKYTEHGGRIELRATREEGEAVISVSDTGIGIPCDRVVACFRAVLAGERASGPAPKAVSASDCRWCVRWWRCIKVR